MHAVRQSFKVELSLVFNQVEPLWMLTNIKIIILDQLWVLFHDLNFAQIHSLFQSFKSLILLSFSVLLLSAITQGRYWLISLLLYFLIENALFFVHLGDAPACRCFESINRGFNRWLIITLNFFLAEHHLVVRFIYGREIAACSFKQSIVVSS